ncbi:hypothetical protein QTP88_008345 [Uroleucon formosanum]
MDLLDDVKAIAVAYILHKRNSAAKKKRYKRRYWVHPMNMKRIQEGQFQVTFMTLRAHLEEFFKYYRMSVTTFDELVQAVQDTA